MDKRIMIVGAPSRSMSETVEIVKAGERRMKGLGNAIGLPVIDQPTDELRRGYYGEVKGELDTEALREANMQELSDLGQEFEAAEVKPEAYERLKRADALEAAYDREQARQAAGHEPSTVELRKAITDRLEAAPERSSQEGLLAAIAASERPGLPSNVSTWMVGATYRNFRNRLFVVTKVEQVTEIGWQISYKELPRGTAIRKMDFAKWLTIMQLVGLAS